MKWECISLLSAGSEEYKLYSLDGLSIRKWCGSDVGGKACCSPRSSHLKDNNTALSPSRKLGDILGLILSEGFQLVGYQLTLFPTCADSCS